MCFTPFSLLLWPLEPLRPLLSKHHLKKARNAISGKWYFTIAINSILLLSNILEPTQTKLFIKGYCHLVNCSLNCLISNFSLFQLKKKTFYKQFLLLFGIKRRKRVSNYVVPFGLPRPLDLVDPLGRPRPRLTGASPPSVVSGFLAAIFSIFKYFLKMKFFVVVDDAKQAKLVKESV